ncbi:hypothetical protein M9H77_21913 [Catharanthus roseus]|uniref:Uncharacterized protein n=1 Tax=Catharanthus roseus TaxID=4058 RepID=A0ACC0ANZ8_CATRO|nr:hypothetical protein M9H77_21913 [Catharanthus roseus]
MCENWQVFVHDGRHNHAIAKLTEEQLIQTEQFRKNHVPPRDILQFFREQNMGCTVSAQKIYNVVAKIKNNRMQGRNTIEEVLCLSAKRVTRSSIEIERTAMCSVTLSLHTRHQLK